MLHAVTATAGLSAIWLLWTGAWRSPAEFALALSAAAVASAISNRAGGASKFFSLAPAMLAHVIARAGAVVNGVRATIAAAFGLRVRMRPALLRARIAGASRDRVLAAFLSSAAPGFALVEGDEDSLLVHTSDEDAPDAVAFAGWDASGRAP